MPLINGHHTRRAPFGARLPQIFEILFLLVETDASVRIERGLGAVQRTRALAFVFRTQHLAHGDWIGIEISAAVEAAGNLGAAIPVVDRGRRPWAEWPVPAWIDTAARRQNRG